MENTPESPSGSQAPSPASNAGAGGTSGQNPSPQGAARRGPPPNPLYHPLFLPALLVPFSLWFFYDGFLTTDPEMLKHQRFNQVMFGITALVCLRVVPRSIREYKEEQAEKAAKEKAAQAADAQNVGRTIE